MAITKEQALANARKRLQPTQSSAAPAEPEGKLNSYVRGLNEVLTLGSADEITAAVDAAVNAPFSDKDFMEIYKESRNRERASNEAAKAENPKTYMAGQGTGIIVSPLGKIGAGAKTGVELARAGAATGVLAGYGFSEREDTAGQLLDAGAGGVAGATGNVLIGKALQAAAPYAKTATGKIKEIVKGLIPSETVAATASQVSGIASQLSQYGDDVAAQFKSGIDDGLTPEQSATRALAKKYKVDLSLGDITQNVRIQGREDLALKGALGSPAESAATAFRANQHEQIGALTKRVSESISRTGSASQVDDLGNSLLTTIKSKAAQSKAAANSQYDLAGELQAAYPAEALRDLPKVIRKAAADYDLGSMPTLQKRLGELDRLLGTKGLKTVKLKTLEGFRRRMNANMPQAGSPEYNAHKILKATLDKVEDDLVSQNLVLGTPEAIAAARQARGAWSRYMQTYFGGEDGKVIGDLVKRDLTGEQAVQKIIGKGVTGLDSSGRIVGRVKDLLGEDSAEFLSMKNHMLARMMGLRSTNELANGDILRNAGTLFSKNLADLKSKNPTLYKSLYNDADRVVMDDAAKILQRVYEKQPGAVNYSNTAPALLRVLNTVANRIPGGQFAIGAANNAFKGYQDAAAGKVIERSMKGDLSLLKGALDSAAKEGGRPIAAALTAKIGAAGAGKMVESLDGKQDSLTSRPKDKQEIIRRAQERLKTRNTNEQPLRQIRIPNKNLGQPLPPQSALPPELRQDEGQELTSYTDTTGNRTVGVGFNMDSGVARKAWKKAGVQAAFNDVYAGEAGITPQEAERLAMASYETAVDDAREFLPAFDRMTENRKQALANLSYQLGSNRLAKFTGFKSAMNKGDYVTAARELVNSKWFDQTQDSRKRRVIQQILKG